MIEKIIPKDESDWLAMRASNVNSTDIAALFGLSPYATEFEFWHRIKGNVVVNFQENQRSKWGKRLEASIAEGVAEDKEWKLRPMKEYWRDPTLRIGSSFDYAIIESFHQPSLEAGAIHAEVIKDLGILEIKNVDGLQFRNGWIVDDDGNIEAPPHIELQVQHQLMLTGLPVAHIAALVGGNDVKLLTRTPDVNIATKIKAKISCFWLSQDRNLPPAPNFAKDAEIIAKLYNQAEFGKVIEPSDDVRRLAKVYKEASLAEKKAKAEKDAAKAEILTLIGNAEKCKAEDFSISASMIKPSVIQYTREGYRDFRVFWKKEKEEK